MSNDLKDPPARKSVFDYSQSFISLSSAYLHDGSASGTPLSRSASHTTGPVSDGPSSRHVATGSCPTRFLTVRHRRALELAGEEPAQEIPQPFLDLGELVGSVRSCRNIREPGAGLGIVPGMPGQISDLRGSEGVAGEIVEVSAPSYPLVRRAFFHLQRWAINV